jgi:signal transduction histidine kinase
MLPDDHVPGSVFAKLRDRRATCRLVLFHTFFGCVPLSVKLSRSVNPVMDATVTSNTATSSQDKAELVCRDREEMDERIAAFDWSATPLGPARQWPQSLRTVVNILLSSRYQMWMAWGRDLTFLYNDAYRPTLGIKHPWALGKPASEVWTEIWPDVGPRIDRVLATGKGSYDQGLLLFLERSGFPEETYHTFSYSPLLDDDGLISGMLCVVSEETERLIGERRVETLRDVASALARANTEDEVLRALRVVLNRNQKDLPFTLTYLFEEDGGAQLASSSGISSEHPRAAVRIEAGSDYPWPANRMFDRPLSHIFDEPSVPKNAGALPAGDWIKPAEQAAIVPIRQPGQGSPAGFFVAGVNPYRRYDAAYNGFIDLLAGQIAAALGNARAYDAERRRAEALAAIDRAKTTFFSNVSHELRTPLTLMLSPVEELLGDSGKRGTADERPLLELVHRNGLRLQKLVNSLLDFSRIEAGRMQAVFEPLDLAAYTAELAANFRSVMERAGLEFAVECEPCPGPVSIDREMWEKIVLNLLSNALKFTFEGTVRVSLKSVGDCLELAVQDTGTGIPASELPHIFERFHRVEGAKGRTIEGTGIGLALVQELVKLHAGTVSVISELGKGSTFTVSIPARSAHLPIEKVRHRGETKADWAPAGTRHSRFIEENHDAGFGDFELPTSRSGERILLADDNADMRAYVGRLLAERFDVIQAANGEEALAAALANPPDLILSDVMMPGLDGFGLLAELRKRPETRTIPVILLSARAGEESRVEGLDAGADDYLIKPFTARELLARIGAHLSMKKRREESERSVRESQATLQSFYDSSPLMMGIVELHGDDIVPIYRNRATAEAVAVGVEGIWTEEYRRSLAERAAVRFDFEHVHEDGNRWLSVVVNCLGTGSEGWPRFSFIAEDVTEKRRADDLLRRSNEELRMANADLEQFAFSASHDLQEPLRQVAVYSQLLQRQFGAELEDKALDYLGFCVEGAQRMAMLIDDLLAYCQAGRAESNSTQLVDVNAVLENVTKTLGMAIAETGAVLTISPMPRVYTEEVPLTQVFQNLVSNAIKYRSDKAPAIAIRATRDDSSWLFAVEDNGIGIEPEFRSQIFGIFKRLHDRAAYPGTGIGLAICQKIVERFGGRIWVESQPGRGSTFFFTLPADRPER